MHVLVIGNTTGDTVLVTEEGIKPGEKVQASRVAHYSGGQAANTAWTLAALGLDVQFVGAFGDDELGRSSAASLRDVGVSLEGSRTFRGCPSQLGIVVVNAATGERSIVMYRDPRLRLDARFNEAWVRDSRLVYLDGHEPEASIAVARQAELLGVPVVSDAETFGSARPEVIPHISCLIAPLSTVAALAGSREIEEALAVVSRGGGPATVVATDGSRGSIALCRGKAPIRVPAPACLPVDTTGAGDAFHAGYIAAVLAEWGFEEALKLASELAATTCEVAGPRISLERIAPFRERLKPARLDWRPSRGRLV
jgi:sulfofructose kinase